MDKRKTVGSEKYLLAHKELLLKSCQILATSSFLDLTFQNLSKVSNYSKTTVYFHFDSNINLLYSDVLNFFREEIHKQVVKKFKKDPILNIKSIYETIFEYINFNPQLYKNLFLISILLSGTKYIGKDKVTPLLENLTLKINKNLNYKDHWSRFTAMSLEYAALEDIKLKQTLQKNFISNLNSILNKN